MLPHLGPMELVIILVIALMIFGAGKLPEVGSALGKGIKEFKKATNDEAPRELAASTAPPAAAPPPAPAAPVAANTPAAASAAPAASATPAAGTPAASGTFCPKCGTQASADSRFCGRCGATIPTAAA
jgi:sec-independent protein translocase protein TatA